jgi:hypothetical protein
VIVGAGCGVADGVGVGGSGVLVASTAVSVGLAVGVVEGTAAVAATSVGVWDGSKVAVIGTSISATALHAANSHRDRNRKTRQKCLTYIDHDNLATGSWLKEIIPVINLLG